MGELSRRVMSKSCLHEAGCITANSMHPRPNLLLFFNSGFNLTREILRQDMIKNHFDGKRPKTLGTL
jgi:hypothetical protein